MKLTGTNVNQCLIKAYLEQKYHRVTICMLKPIFTLTLYSGLQANDLYICGNHLKLIVCERVCVYMTCACE